MSLLTCATYLDLSRKQSLVFIVVGDLHRCGILYMMEYMRVGKIDAFDDDPMYVRLPEFL